MKTVLTYSWLARKAMAMFRKDKDEYWKLVHGEGSEKLVRGFKVRWNINGASLIQSFDLRDAKGGRLYCRMTAAIRSEKVYTYYALKFGPTTYRKRLTDKYMPVTLPQGVRSRYNNLGHYTKCIIHNADGSVAKETTWVGGRRGKSGSLDNDESLVICDTTGQYVGDNAKLVEELQLDGQYENMKCGLGWFDAACQTRTEWIESIRSIPDGLVDHKKMGTVAAKTYLHASRLVTKYPHVRMALFPAVRYHEKGKESDFQAQRHGGDHAPMTVMAHDEASRKAVVWLLPEVLLYWRDEKAERFGSPAYVRICMRIPPYGNPLMDPTGHASPLSHTVRHREDVRSYHNPGLCMEMPYHSLRAWKKSSDADAYGFDFVGGAKVYNPATLTDHEQKMVMWHEHSDLVFVEAECESDDAECPVELGKPVGMKPEDLALLFEEKLLLDSLPLC